jgi:glycosyltransferase involved in cell wall biosynthesis
MTVPLAEQSGLKSAIFGGWVESLLNELKQRKDVSLGIVSLVPIKEIIRVKQDTTLYYGIPSKGLDRNIKKEHCEYVLNDFKPDILHIQGNEFFNTNTFFKCFKGKNIVALQGVLNGCNLHQYGGLLIDEMMFSFSIKKMMMGWWMHLKKQFCFNPRLQKELQTMRQAQNFFGRTEWDRAFSYSINPDANYYYGGEILRPIFYEKQWTHTEKTPYSLFAGNGYSALKGVHYAIRAVALLKREYPSVHLFVAGEPPYFRKKTDIKKTGGYSLYLRNLIKSLKVEDNVTFLGMQNAEQMADRMTHSHVYVLCSTIENSPNTLGEAMLMGVPCVAAYVGGVPDMATDGQEAMFYRDCEPEALAWKIKQIFNDDSLATRLSENANKRATITYSKEKIVDSIIAAYKKI